MRTTLCIAMEQPVASSITAVLGPTNTGKTHRAVERMLAHDSGMIGFPLRLLAREIYDRVTARIGEGEVALVTGEEKRVPQRPRYWICTVEAMPVGLDVDFLAVDEIQLVSHPERGHVFTDRLLRARGVRETWFLGSETARGLVERLAPAARIASHPRLSRLTSAGQWSLGALPRRSAVVAFSATRVYELAERLRQRRGGAAVVLGALSPRARNAQVSLFQSGEVDFIVATDAIGMGLNLDVKSVAFAEVSKFDGRAQRHLELAELGQIAGRAGRYSSDGTFGTLSPLPPLSDATTRALEQHSFPPERVAFYRNHDLDFSSIPALAQSLKVRPRQGYLKLVDHAADTSVLVQLSSRPEIAERAVKPQDVALLWDVCRIPDFRELLLDYHVNLLSEVFLQLTSRGAIDGEWMAAQIQRVDDTEGDLDALLMRMASVRTFTYISNQPAWLGRPGEWQERTRAVEDRLSDALHGKLVARFVDERRGATGPGPRRQSRPRAEPAAPEEPIRSDHPFGRLLSLRDELARKQGLQADSAGDDPDAFVEGLISAPHGRFTVDARGVVQDGATSIARLTRGSDVLRPEVAVTLSELQPGARSRVQRRLLSWGRDLVSELVGPLRGDTLRELGASARGVVYQLEQHLGTLRVTQAAAQLAQLTPDDRLLLEQAGLHMGRTLIYLAQSLTAASVRARAALLSAYHGAPVPEPLGASVARVRGIEPDVYTALGYPLFGPRAIRADIAERVGDVLLGAGEAPFAPLGELTVWLGCEKGDLYAIVEAFGYRPVAGGRFVRRAIQSA
jgi:ATP-dependent RNA helicase SUPV3L1/SUV3